jgi:hypothetical protein
MRGVPDVAGDANQQGGAPIVLASGSQSAVNSSPGTSAATALWAGLMALADQDAHHGLGFVNPALYRIARTSSYHQAFHDITTGTNLTLGPVNDSYQAGPGWDPVTGWGSPARRRSSPCWPAARHTRIRRPPGVCQRRAGPDSSNRPRPDRGPRRGIRERAGLSSRVPYPEISQSGGVAAWAALTAR